MESFADKYSLDSWESINFDLTKIGMESILRI